MTPRRTTGLYRRQPRRREDARVHDELKLGVVADGQDGSARAAAEL
jgi:hypothetical protein